MDVLISVTYDEVNVTLNVIEYAYVAFPAPRFGGLLRMRNISAADGLLSLICKDSCGTTRVADQRQFRPAVKQAVGARQNPAVVPAGFRLLRAIADCHWLPFLPTYLLSRPSSFPLERRVTGPGGAGKSHGRASGRSPYAPG